MRRKIKERWIALICAICMLCSFGLEGVPVFAEDANNVTDVTLENAPEWYFKRWTFADLGIQPQTMTGSGLNWSNNPTYPAIGTSLDNTIFNAKIKFDNTQANQIVFIGGNSTWKGFRLYPSGQGAETLTFDYQYGNAATPIATFNKTTAQTTLVGNSNLQLSISIEYLSEQKVNNVDCVTMKVGVFFDGKLYDNTYYTVSDIPKEQLQQIVRIYNSKHTIASDYLWDITLGSAPEKQFTKWSFNTLGISNDSVTGGNLNWAGAYSGGSLDKTIFAGKINFKDTLSNFYIGGGAYWNGFLIQANGSDGLKLSWQQGNAVTPIVTFDKAIAGTTLRGNSELQLAFSVEYVKEETVDDVVYVDVRLGIFFDGKLYDNTYYTIEHIPKNLLKQDVRIYQGGQYDVASVDLTDITLETAPEAEYSNWTFSNLGIDDDVLAGSSLNWGNEYPAIGTTLDKTIFSGKIKFDNTQANQIIFIGGNGNWKGFRLYPSAIGAKTLTLDYQYGNGATPIDVLDPKTAGTALVGNEELQVAFSVEYLSEQTVDNVEYVTAKVGVFFDGGLYNNRYYIIDGILKEQLHQVIRIYNSKHGIASDYIEEPIPIEDITLETAPEKDFANWTFTDLGIADQVLTGSSLNWGNEYPAIGTTLDKTIFSGKINFVTTGGGTVFIGGNQNWRGFRLYADGTDGLKLDYQYSDAGVKPIATFDSETAGITLQGNKDLQVAFSVEYLGTSGDNVTIQVGMFFNEKLYNNTYYTVNDIPVEQLNQVIRIYNSKNEIASDYVKEPIPVEDITLETAPEKDFANWTFTDLGIADQVLTGSSLNWGNEYPAIGTTLDKTIFSGKINFVTTGGGTVFIGGNQNWRGFRLYADGTDGLKLDYQYSDAGVKPIATFDSETAGITLQGNKDLQVAFSVEYLGTSGDNVTIQVGVFFNDKLYNNTYYTVAGIPVEQLQQVIRIYNSKNSIVSYYLKEEKPEDTVPGTTQYEELTVHDFSILDTCVESIPTGRKDYRIENYCDWALLDKTAVSMVCKFPEKGSARISIGGAFWEGIFVDITNNGDLEVAHLNTDGTVNRIVNMSPDVANMDSFTGKEITIRFTFDITEKENGKSDYQLGIYINGNLYDDKFFSVRNVDTSTLTRTMKLYVTQVPFTVQSVEETPDLSIYGFNNKTWKKELGL